MFCLGCGTELKKAVSWHSLFAKEEGPVLCQECLEKLEMITGEVCGLCSRPLGQNRYQQDGICLDCLRWEENEAWSGVLDRNISVLMYNDYCKELIALFKYRGDYAVAAAFASLLKHKLQTLTYDLIVPVPLSPERLYERGFNQSEALILSLGKEPAHLLSRKHSEKQSKKSRHDRIHLPQVFQLTQQTNLSGKQIVLIDDIYTTGSTLRHAAILLKEAGAKTVTSLTVARG
ncbi:ComF family protein [Cytobacillus gottheilii]|uniref:ComF family protein n=1 Tax=Cytobacillus gottheilii TaxID=859144 RepID=A0ABX8FA12_9BACI|nr:ComF family protein [Cytobacillus gottheilii]QVY61220.1 ComF family protein [Cytobacillus gottheilii]